MISQQDYKFFDVAKSVAKTSTHHKAQIGAIIVYGKEIISVGVNGLKSHPLQQHYNKLRFDDDRAHHLMHAELDAVIKGKKYLKSGSRMYVARTLANGGLGMCRPCVSCRKMLMDFNIQEIYYTTESGHVFEEFI